MELMETFHIITTRQSFLSKFKFSIDPRGDLATKTMCFICLSGKISKQTEKAAFSSNQMFNVNDSLMNGTKRVRINSFFLRIKQEYFQPKNGTITRIFSLGRKKNFLIYKKQCITRIFDSGFWAFYQWYMYLMLRSLSCTKSPASVGCKGLKLNRRLFRDYFLRVTTFLTVLNYI